MFTRARHFLFGFSASATLLIIRNIEAAPFEDNWSGVNDTAGLSLTLRTHGYRLIIKILLPLKMAVTSTAFILINRHNFTSHKVSPDILL